MCKAREVKKSDFIPSGEGYQSKSVYNIIRGMKAQINIRFLSIPSGTTHRNYLLVTLIIHKANTYSTSKAFSPYYFIT